MKKQNYNDYEIILSYSTFSSLLNKKIQAWQRGDTGFPQMGEEGCGNRNPTRFLLICLQCLKFAVLCDLENVFKET